MHQHISSNNQVDEKDVRIMLGLADKSKTIKLIKNTFEGNAKESNKILKDLIDEGLDAKSFLQDVLEILSLINRKLSLGSINNDKMLPEAEIDLIDKISNGLSISDIGLFWQLTLKTIEDLKTLGDEMITLEMYVSQLIFVKGVQSEDKKNFTLETNEDSFKNQSNTVEVNNNEKSSLKVKSQLKSTEQIKTKIINNPKINNKETGKHKVENFEDIVSLANKENDIELKYDLERNVNLVSFSYGKIDISFNEKLNKNFIKILTERLLLWTGDRWIISLSQNLGDKTLYEKKIDEKKMQLKNAKNDKDIKKVMNAFNDAKLIEIKNNED